MPLFVLSCLDKPDSLPLRMANREAHLAYAQAAGVVRVAGPYLNDEGQMCGSLLIVEMEDKAAVEAFAAGDPYAKAGLFQSVDIRGWRGVIGDA